MATINVRYEDDGLRNINYINDCIQSGILNRSKIDFQSPSSSSLIDLHRSGVQENVSVLGADDKFYTTATTNDDWMLFDTNLLGYMFVDLNNQVQDGKTGKSISEQHPLDLQINIKRDLTGAIAFRGESTEMSSNPDYMTKMPN